MGGRKGFTTLLAVGLGHTLALAAPPAAEPPRVVAGQQAAEPKKVPPIDYIKAGAYLFNKGQVEKAAKYFDAAEKLRSELNENEQIVLEVYREEIEKTQKPGKQTAPTRDASVAPASTVQTPAMAGSNQPTQTQPQPAAGGVASNNSDMSMPLPGLGALRSQTRYDSTDPKQRARWLIQEAREEMAKGHYEEAERKIEESRALNVKWSFLEETPDKTAKILAKVRAKSPNGPAVPSARPLGIRSVAP